ncbi:MAG TPA: hypothetical protein VHI51_18305 [Ktedonobacterales bacterium]|jgi:phosphate uptake regulator|nr:hypothetical protein [Ktedonobacterales bacterium]
MAQTVGPTEDLPEAIGRLASDTTEMGIVVCDAFRYSCAGLFVPEPESARFAIESAGWAVTARAVLDRRVRDVIQRYVPIGDDMRRIAELRQAVSEYSRIADLSGHIADWSLVLAGQGDELLQRYAPDAPDILGMLISLVYQQMRGAFLVTAARNLEQAQVLVQRDEEVQEFSAALLVRLQYAIKQEPFAALPLQRLVMIATNIREVNASVVAICKGVLPASAVLSPPPVY